MSKVVLNRGAGEAVSMARSNLRNTGLRACGCCADAH
jgi:hypothetical protein